MDLITFLLTAILLLLFWTYLGYPLSLAILIKLKNYEKQLSVFFSNNCLYEPNVSIIIPTYNEEKVIESKLKNCLELDYANDKLEIIVVDSASLDRTVEIVEKFQDNRIKLIIQNERRGKAEAVNEALKHAEGEIVFVTDANVLLSENTLKNIVIHFVNPVVGGVEGRYVVERKPGNVVSYKESLFRRIENWIKEKESLVDSVAGMVGELSAFRRVIIDKFDESAVAEDFEMSIAIRKKGYILAYEPSVTVRELAASSLRDEVVQKKRRVIGTIQALLKHGDTLFNPKFGLYGVYILPSHKLLQIISPFLVILMIVLSISGYIITRSMLTNILSLTAFSCVAFGVAILLMAKFNRGIENPMIAGIGYFLLMQLIVLFAWWDYLRGNYSVKWEKIESSREQGLLMNIVNS